MEENESAYRLLTNKDSDSITSIKSRNDKDIGIVWLDEESMNEESPNYRQTITMIKEICGDNYKLYNCKDSFLTDIEILTRTNELIVIMSGKLAEITLAELTLSLLRELSSIFIFCQDYDNYKYLRKRCRKINDICNDPDALMEAIKHEIRPPISVTTARNLKSVFILKEDLKEFIMYQLQIELVKHYRWVTDDREKMVNKCMENYSKNKEQKKRIREFKNQYSPDKAIEWYTSDSFFYRSVNNALRSLDIEEINIFRPYIKDLCKQLEKLHRENQCDRPLTVFRGHGNMSKLQLDKYKQSIGTLVSFNGFLSTSTDYNVALMFAGAKSAYEACVVFEIKTNYNLKNVIFANISKFSNIEDEEEVLFGLCSVFKIDGVEYDDVNQLWRVVMSATDKDTLDLQDYIKQRAELHERVEIENTTDDEMLQLINDELDTEPSAMRTSNYLLYCTNRFNRYKSIIVVSTVIFITIAAALAVALGINLKLKHQMSSPENCKGTNCTTFLSSAVTRQQSTSPINFIRSNSITSTILYEATREISERCFSFGWNSEFNEIATSEVRMVFAVDDDFNIYVPNEARKSLQKWSPNNELISEYFVGWFKSCPMFFHSSSQSIYFAYEWNKKLGVYKLLINENMTLVTVIDEIIAGNGFRLRVGYPSEQLYVDSLGNIFVMDNDSGDIFKWTVNDTYFMLVANSHSRSSLYYDKVFAIDEINNIIYFADMNNARLLKYTNGSQTGIIIIDANPPYEMLSGKPSKRSIGPIVVDRTGNLIMLESGKVGIWTPDGKFYKTVFESYQIFHYTELLKVPRHVILNRVGNLYVSTLNQGGVLVFNRTSVTCSNSTS